MTLWTIPDWTVRSSVSSSHNLQPAAMAHLCDAGWKQQR